MVKRPGKQTVQELAASVQTRIHEPADLATVWVTDCVSVGLVSGVFVVAFAQQRFELDGLEGTASPHIGKHVVVRLAMSSSSIKELLARVQHAESVVASALARKSDDVIN